MAIDFWHNFFSTITMEGWEVIQGCTVTSEVFDRAKFIARIVSLAPEEFNRFCKEYLHLREFYDTNKSAWVTDHIPHVKQYPDLFWRLKPIDFDGPVNFERIQ